MLEFNEGCSDLVGGDLTDMPGISAFGAFVRVVRLNHISPKGFFSVFGIRNRRTEDLSHRLTFSVSSQCKVADSLGLTSVPTCNFFQWLPFQCDPIIFESHWNFRYCPACLHQGLHTFLHQLPWFTHCPWHRCRLRIKCTVCDAPLSVASSDNRPLLVCRNGHDHFNEVASCCSLFGLSRVAAKFMDHYLTWAAERREQWKLLAPEDSTTTISQWSSMIQMPSSCHESCHQFFPASPVAHARTFHRNAEPALGVSELPSAFSKLQTLLQRGVGLELPKTFEPGFTRIACSLAEQLPPESLTDSEIHLFFDGLERQPDHSFKPARRPGYADIKFLPPLLVGQRRIINLGTLNARALQSVRQLLISNFGELSEPLSSRDEGSRRLFLRVAADVLKRAYAEGIRTILAGYVPALFDSKRDRPHPSEPWILTRSERDHLQEVQVIWVRSSHSQRHTE
jgi:hypothetical protein